MNEIDAVKVLECMAIDMMGALAGLSKKEPLADVLCQRIEAINLAQSALREKAEREKGCEYCNPNPYGHGEAIKPLTNADRIRSMSDEELAEWLVDANMCERVCTEEDYCGCDVCVNRVTDWLKQPAKEE